MSETLVTHTSPEETVVSLRPRWRLAWRISGWAIIAFGGLGGVGVFLEWNTRPEMRGTLIACFLCIGAGFWVAEWLMQTVHIAVTKRELRFTRQFSAGRWRRTVPLDAVQAVHRTYRTPERNHRHGEWRVEVWIGDKRRWRAMAATEADAWRAQRLLCNALGLSEPPEPRGMVEQELRARVPGTITRW